MIIKKLRSSKIFRKEILIFILLTLFLTLIVFRKYILNGLLPIPGDIIPGLYFPWFDYKWGYATPVPVKNSLPSDVVSIMYPWRIMGIDLLRQFQLPLWDSTILLGTPLLANFQSALLNPFNILYLILPNIHAWSIQVILQPVLMITAMYIFLRSIKLSTYSSLFGGILYAFSGYSIVWMEYNSINYTLVYFPLILWSVKKIIEGSKRVIPVFAALIAFQIMSGYPLVTLFTLVFSFVYLVFASLNKSYKELFNKVYTNNNGHLKNKDYFNNLIKNLSKQAISFFIGVILGIGLSAVQLIPSIELQKLSIRNYDTVAASGGVKYLPLNQLITLFVSDYFGNPGTGNYWGSGSYDNFAFSISSVGIYFTVLFLISRKYSSKLYLFYTLSLLTVIIFVTENPLSVSFGKLFPSFISNVNTRALFIVSFVLSVFAAKGMEISFSNSISFWKKIIPVFIYLIILAYLAVQLLSGDFSLTFDNLRSHLSYVYRREESDVFISFKNTLFPSTFVIFSFLILLVTKKNRKIGMLLIFSLLIFSVTKSTDKYLSFTKKDLMYPTTGVIEYLKNNSAYGRFGKERKDLIFPSNTWSLYGLESAAGQNASAPMRTAKYLSVINTGEYRNVLPSRYQDVWNTNSPLYNTLNISHYLALNWNRQNSPSPLGVPNDIYLSDKFGKETQIGTVSIYGNPDNLGPAWYPSSVVCEDEDEKIFKELTKSDYDPDLLVFINCEGEFENNSGGAEIQLIEFQPNYKIFETNTNAESFLVISSAYYPGWVYYIDGENKTGVYKANTALTAVKVPKGIHTIKLVYDPISFKIGLIVSGLTLVLWIYFLKRSFTNKK